MFSGGSNVARGFFRLWNKADSISRQRQRFLLSQKPKLLSETAMMAMFFFARSDGVGFISARLKFLVVTARPRKQPTPCAAYQSGVGPT